MTISDYSSFYFTIQHMNEEEIYSYFHSIYMYNVLTIIAIATGSLALREYLGFLGAEYRTWKLLFQGRIMPARLAIIIVRYAYIGAFISAVYFLTGKPKPKECKPLLKLVFGLYTILWSASGSIFLMRLNIIFSRQRKIMILFYFLWLSCICLWSFITFKMNAFPIPKSLQFPFGPTCTTDRMPKITAIAWAGSILFDSIVFISTFIRFRNVNNKSKSNNQKGNLTNTTKIFHLRSKIWIFRSSLYYFAASFIFNSSMLIISLIVNDPMMSNCGNALAFAIHSIVATRLVFNTKGWSQNDSLEEDENEVMLNTFNKNRRNENGILSNNNIHPTASRITYTVDETVVTSFIDRENNNTTQEIDDQIDELRTNSSNKHKKSFRKSRDQIGITEFDSKEDEEHTIQSGGKSCRNRGIPYDDDHHHQNTLPKVSTSRKGSIQQQKVTNLGLSRESIESLETKYSSKDDFAIRRKQEQIIPIPPNLYRPETFTQNRRQSLLKGGKSKALLDIAIENPYASSSSSQSKSINEESRVSSSASIINNKKNLQISACPIPSPPGTLSSPPSYSVLDRLAKSEEDEDEIPACTFSNKSPSLPSSYEIQQYQEYLLNVSKDENGESSSNSK